MSIVSFFAASGMLAWCWLAWRCARACRAHYRRLKWALSGYRQPRRFSRLR